MRNAVSQAELDLLKSQQKSSDTQSGIASDYNEYNKSTFRPLEKGIVSSAEGYDTPQRRADAARAAAADVEQAYGTANTGLTQDLRREGVTTGSGRNASLMQDAALSKAAAEAGATTQATRNVEQQGYAREMDAASLGRGLPSAQATAQSVGTQAANSAVSAGNSAVATTNSGVPQVMQGYSGAVGATLGAGNLYGQAASTYNNIASQDSQGLTMLGNAAGRYAGSTAGSTQIAGWLSDETKKTGTGKKIDGEKALEGIEKTPVESGWSYDPAKGGPDEGGQPHSGPMAQTVRKTMGEDVAPGGTHVDAASLNGHMLAGMQVLAKRVKKLERRAK